MTASTTLQSKILRTKKRLSNGLWNLPQIILASMGLMVILSFLLRSISVAGTYGLVPAQIPVLSEPIEDTTYYNFIETTQRSLALDTPVIFLTEDSFLFGELAAFTTNLSSVRNKFIVRHVEGAPNLRQLLTDLERWMYTRLSERKIRNSGVVIFAPTEEIPSPIVIQVVAALRNSTLFEDVILAGGMM